MNNALWSPRGAQAGERTRTAGGTPRISYTKWGGGLVARGESVRYSARPHPFLQQASGQIFKDDIDGFSSISDICFMVIKLSGLIGTCLQRGP